NSSQTSLASEAGQPSPCTTEIAATIEQAVARIVATVNVDQGIQLNRCPLEPVGDFDHGLYSCEDQRIVELSDGWVLVGEPHIGANPEIVCDAERVHVG